MPAIIDVVNLRFFTTELHGVTRSFKTIPVFSSVKLRVLRGYILYLLLLLAFFTLSCKSAPKTTGMMPNENSSIPLDAGALGYIFADVQKSRPILESINFNGMNNDKQFQQMLDSTQFAVLATYPPQSPRRYQLVAWGDYPSSRAKMALGASKGWKNTRSAVSGNAYWYNEQLRLSIGINPTQAFMLALRENKPADASADIPTDPFSAAPGITVPHGFSAFSKDAVFSCWFENPGSFLNQKLQTMGIPFELPAERIFISLSPVNEEQQKEQRYEARLKILVSSETQARGLATVFNIARGFLSLQTGSDDMTVFASILFTKAPVLDGKSLNITTAALSGKELTLLFKVFSL